MIGRRGAAVALSSLVLVGSSWAGAPAGQADEGRHRASVLCQGPSESTYDPPLTSTSRETRVRMEAHYECTVAPGRTVSATGSLDGVSPTASCDGLSSPRVTEVVRYADGERSLIDYDSGTTIRTAAILDVRLTGRVVEGRGEGQPAERDVFLAPPHQSPTECAGSGITGNSGQAQLKVQP